MSIAISCACGPLHKWGYQWTAYECLASQAEFADVVYLVQSTSDATGVKELQEKYPNIVLISNRLTWHHKPGEGDDNLTVYPDPIMGSFTTFHMRNLSIGRRVAFVDGHNIVMSTHSNWYIPQKNIEPLREYCKDFEKSGVVSCDGWAIGQLHDRLNGPAVRRETICNLTGLDEHLVMTYYPEMKGRHFSPPDDVMDICLVDASYNLLPAEFEGMQRRFHYPESETFEWETYKEKLIARMKRKTYLLDEPLDYWGELIARKSTPDFMGYQLLQGMLDEVGIP
jgi:hypothetical protein